MSLSSQSWWVWSETEIRDLWFNCFHDNETKAWLCTTSSESGQWPAHTLAHSDLCPFTTLCEWDFLHLPHTWCASLTFLSPRLAAVDPGPHDPLSCLLLHLLPCVPGSAHHAVQGRTLLLHWPLPGLCRSGEQSYYFLTARTPMKFWRMAATIEFLLETWKLASFGFTDDEVLRCSLKNECFSNNYCTVL